MLIKCYQYNDVYPIHCKIPIRFPLLIMAKQIGYYENPITYTQVQTLPNSIMDEYIEKALNVHNIPWNTYNTKTG